MGWSWVKVMGRNPIRWSGMTATVTFQLFHKDTIISYCLWNWSLTLNTILNLRHCLRGDVTQFIVWNGVIWGPEEPHKFSRVTSCICGRTEAQMSLPAPASYSMAGPRSPPRFMKIYEVDSTPWKGTAGHKLNRAHQILLPAKPRRKRNSRGCWAHPHPPDWRPPGLPWRLLSGLVWLDLISQFSSTY